MANHRSAPGVNTRSPFLNNRSRRNGDDDRLSELIGSVGYGFGVKTEPTSLEESANQNYHWKPLPK